MTASLSAPYALVGEQTPSQPAHQKSLPPGPPHASVQQAAVVVDAAKAVVPKPVVRPAVIRPAVVKTTTVPALPAEPIVANLPDVPAMGS